MSSTDPYLPSLDKLFEAATAIYSARIASDPAVIDYRKSSHEEIYLKELEGTTPVTEAISESTKEAIELWRVCEAALEYEKDGEEALWDMIFDKRGQYDQWRKGNSLSAKTFEEKETLEHEELLSRLYPTYANKERRRRFINLMGSGDENFPEGFDGAIWSVPDVRRILKDLNEQKSKKAAEAGKKSGSAKNKVTVKPKSQKKR